MQAADDWEELSRLIESGEARPGERGIEPLNGD